MRLVILTRKLYLVISSLSRDSYHLMHEASGRSLVHALIRRIKDETPQTVKHLLDTKRDRLRQEGVIRGVIVVPDGLIPVELGHTITGQGIGQGESDWPVACNQYAAMRA